MSYTKEELEWFEEFDNQFSEEDRKKELEEIVKTVNEELEEECAKGNFMFKFKTKRETGEEVEYDVYECCGRCKEV